MKKFISNLAFCVFVCTAVLLIYVLLLYGILALLTSKYFALQGVAIFLVTFLFILCVIGAVILVRRCATIHKATKEIKKDADMLSDLNFNVDPETLNQVSNIVFNKFFDENTAGPAAAEPVSDPDLDGGRQGEQP